MKHDNYKIGDVVISDTNNIYKIIGALERNPGHRDAAYPSKLLYAGDPSMASRNDIRLGAIVRKLTKQEVFLKVL